jgi:ankyrin repeat protein
VTADIQYLLHVLFCFFFSLPFWYSFPKRNARELTARYVFLDYASNNWAEHFREMSLPGRDEWFPLSFDLFVVERECCMDWEVVLSSILHYLQPNSLYLASYLGLEKAVSKLIVEYGFDVNIPTTDGSAPLYLGVLASHTEIVKRLLKISGINVNKSNDDGFTPFLAAIYEHYPETIKLLINANDIDVNKLNNSGFTPLSLAISMGYTEAVGLLLHSPNLDGKIEVANSKFQSGLLMAISKGCTEVVELLLKAPSLDISIGFDGSLPLINSIASGHTHIVELLLKTWDIDANERHANGRTALEWAMSLDHEASEVLISCSDSIRDNKHSEKNAGDVHISDFTTHNGDSKN